MKITGSESEQSIIKELGNRIKQYRIASNFTQSELAFKCGISLSTEVRIENGVDSKISNYIKILGVLELLQNLDILIPAPQQDFRSIYEKKVPRQRVRTHKSKQQSNWIWGEDK